MTLRTRLTLCLALVVCLFTSISWVIERSVVMPSFLLLEHELALKDLGRVQAAIDNELQHLDRFTTDWAAWDDTYAFVEDRNEAYVEANLSKAYFEAGNFTAAYYIALDGRVVWGTARDPERDFEAMEIAQLAGSTWPQDHVLLGNRDLTRGRAGLMKLPQGLLLVASRPIITSTKEGPMRGWLVLCKQLAPDLVAELRMQTDLEFDLLALDDGNLSAADRLAFEQLQLGSADFLDRRDDAKMLAYAALKGLSGQPVQLLRVSLPRDIRARGAAAVEFALLSLAGASLLLLLVLRVLLGRVVVEPISELTAHAVAIGGSEDLVDRLRSSRKDEIGVLAREFDAMVERLARSRSELLDVARQAGRSEIATNVLHNVGNVLNSVNVSKEVLQSRLQLVDPRTLEKLLDLLLAHQDDLGRFIDEDPVGKNLPHFLKVMVESLASNQLLAQQECAQMDQGLAHLRALVAAQQEFAGAAGVAEFTSVVELIERALHIASAKVGEHGIVVERDLQADLPLCKLQKHRVLESLVNLLCNAFEAVLAGGVDAPCVRVRLRRRDAAMLRIEIEDNGVGIAAENLTRIFQHGFTTKPQGHGFGLHASAIGMRQIGGDLTVTSEGPGRGARFVVDVPVEAEQPRQDLRSS